MSTGDAMQQKPKLRFVEAFALGADQPGMFAVRDPSGIAEGVMTISEAALFLLSQFDGERTLAMTAAAFAERYGQPVAEDTLLGLVDRLEQSQLLDGPQFDAYLKSLHDEYRAAATRKAVCADFWPNKDDARAFMSEMLPSRNGEVAAHRVAGLVAPHLDYPRGFPCYRQAYGSLIGRDCPDRVLIFGTNHFGRATSVVATSKPFETPFGITNVDGAFLHEIEQRCGQGLCADEFDHKREHSVELQVMCLQHMFGAENFAIVPFLCPNPCGPTGMKPFDGRGVHLDDFASAIRDAIRESDADTLLIAGADLSHVGQEFGDSFRIDDDFLTTVEARDHDALERLTAREPISFVETVAFEDNPTRICSAGCMYVVAEALPDAEPELLHYHQAFDDQQQVCVTCSAIRYTMPG